MLSDRIQEEKLILCLKISQQKWIERLAAGYAWFGSIDGYIKKAEKDGNNEQGDKYEGLFARCSLNSPIIINEKKKFGDDLEIIHDGDYCMLRRKSCRDALAFCVYGIKDTDVTLIGPPYLDDNGRLLSKFKYDINHKMYDGFLQDGSSISDVSGFYCSAGHLNESIEKALYNTRHKWKRSMIMYDVDLSKEFFIEPGPGFPELMHKRIDLAYQHESRILIIGHYPVSNGVELHFEPINLNSGNFALGKLYIEGTAILEKL